LLYSFRLTSNGNGLVTFETRFHQAAFVMAPAFLIVLIADMDFDPGNMVREVAQGTLNNRFGLPDFATVDVMTGIDLNFHNLVPNFLSIVNNSSELRVLFPTFPQYSMASYELGG
jgi:hypothetical protein